MASKIMHLSLFMFAMFGCIMSVNSATTHRVGGPQGWNVPLVREYKDWVTNQTFALGDTLHFKYYQGLNTVVEVEKWDYDHCTSTKTIRAYFNGDTYITLEKAGDYYFYCSVGMHCEGGQKLHITVAN